MALQERDLPKPAGVTSLSIIDNVNVQLVQETMRKISSFQAVVKNTLREGHDYGVIPGTSSKPTLLKPGAEKILMLLGLSSEYELIEKVLDYEKGFFAFTVKCVVYRDGRKITEGMGHANTRERRYTSGKQQDAYTLANTVLKMAKKRAQVDAVLTVASLSEIFTQDLEDELDEDIAARQEPQKQTRQPNRQAQPPQRAQNGHINWSMFWARTKAPKAKGGLGLTEEKIKEWAREWFDGAEFESLTEVVKTQKQLDELLEFITEKARLAEMEAQEQA